MVEQGSRRYQLEGLSLTEVQLKRKLNSEPVSLASRSIQEREELLAAEDVLSYMTSIAFLNRVPNSYCLFIPGMRNQYD